MSLHIDSTHSRRPRRAVHSGLGKNGPDKNGPGKNGPEKTVRGIIWLVVESVKTVRSFR